MLLQLRTLSTLLLALSPLTVLAQVQTDCQPLERDDCPPNEALGTYAAFNWTKSGVDGKVWDQNSTKVQFTPDGAQFNIATKNDAPVLRSLFHIFFGRVSIIMRASHGAGIVSSVMLISSDEDEIDWEWIGSEQDAVQSNFFGKGDNSTFGRMVKHKVNNILDVHNYTIVHTAEKIDWIIDDNVVRTIKINDRMASSDNKTMGDRFPQTPMKVSLGNWRGGDSPSEGTRDWAGGAIDYSKGPFVQKVEAVEVEDFSKGSLYTYGDRTGSYKSIKVTPGNSTIADRLSRPQGVQNKFNALPQGAKIAIFAAIIAVAAVSVIVLTFCCIKHRRAGKKERALADAQWEKDVQELRSLKTAYIAEEEIHPRRI